jgi:hypothetical protein
MNDQQNGRRRPMVAQATLARYIELRPLATEFKVIEEALRADLAAGAVVEPGPFTANVNVEHKPRLLQEYLFQALHLSAEDVQDLRDNAPLVPHRYLSVGRTPADADLRESSVTSRSVRRPNRHGRSRGE